MDQEPASCSELADPHPLRSVHTTGFPPVMRRLGISLLVTSHQADKRVIVHDPAVLDGSCFLMSAAFEALLAPLRSLARDSSNQEME